MSRLAPRGTTGTLVDWHDNFATVEEDSMKVCIVSNEEAIVHLLECFIYAGLAERSHDGFALTAPSSHADPEQWCHSLAQRLDSFGFVAHVVE